MFFDVSSSCFRLFQWRSEGGWGGGGGGGICPRAQGIRGAKIDSFHR